MLPKISIVTPCLNHARYIGHAMASVLGQNYPNLEYIVVDGGSTDGSYDIIKSFAPHLAYHVSEPDKRHGEALNKGFRVATGEIMAWLNSDDLYAPWTLRTVAEIFSTFPDVNWIMATPADWNHHGTLVKVRPTLLDAFDFLNGNFRWIQQESVFWRRSLWERAGGHIAQDYRFMVDGELWTRFFLLDNMWALQAILGGYRFHGQNRSHRFYAECEAEMERAVAVMRQRVAHERLDMKRVNPFYPEYPSILFDFEKSRWYKACIPRAMIAGRKTEN